MDWNQDVLHLRVNIVKPWMLPQSLTRIYDILEDIGNAKIFSSLYLKSGYWQISLDRESQMYTDFTTSSWGQYQFRVMPFGLKNAPLTLQNLMRGISEE